MDLPNSDKKKIRESFRNIIKWLRSGETHHDFPWALNSSPGLTDDTPIVLLSSLAPGVDQVIAEEAHTLGIRVKSPLPYPPAQYEKASTFTRFKKDGTPDPDNEKRVTHFKKLCAKIGNEHSFHVRMPGDLSLTEVKLAEQLESEVERPENDSDKAREQRRLAQNLRYRAAGEYVSAYCDLLLAFTDLNPVSSERLERRKGLPDRAQSGTDWIMHSHLTGRRVGILPIPTPISTSSNGLVLRVFTRRSGKSRPDDPIGRIDLFTPKDCPDFDENFYLPHEIELARLREHTKALSLFFGKIRNLWEQHKHESRYQIETRFAQDYPVEGKLPFSPARPDEKNSRKGARICKQDCLEGLPKIGKQLVLRRLIADLNRQLDGQAKTVTKRLFTLAFLALFLLQIPVLWSWPSPIFGETSNHLFLTIVIFLIVGLGWRYYFKQAGEGLYDLQNDTRAAAEAMRVQHYWIASGTGASVASQFAQRTRGQVAWIRSLVSVHALPYEDSVSHFKKLGHEQQQAILERVRNGWLCEQENYFGKKYYDFFEERLTTSLKARICIWVGFTLAFFTSWPLKVDLFHLLPGVIILAIICVIGKKILSAMAWKTCEASKNILQESRIDFGELEKRRLWRILRPLVSCIRHIKTRNKPLTSSYAEKGNSLTHIDNRETTFHIRHLAWLNRKTLSASGYFPLLSGFLIGLAIWASLPALTSFLSCSSQSIVPLGSALRNIFFGVSGLLGSKIAVKFLTENINRYRSMQDVFTGARQKLDLLLDDFGRTDDTELRNEILREVHDLLRNLGNEAIFENSDWLQMHRNRPIKPVFPSIS